MWENPSRGERQQRTLLSTWPLWKRFSAISGHGPTFMGKSGVVSLAAAHYALPLRHSSEFLNFLSEKNGVKTFPLTVMMVIPGLGRKKTFPLLLARGWWWWGPTESGGRGGVRTIFSYRVPGVSLSRAAAPFFGALCSSHFFTGWRGRQKRTFFYQPCLLPNMRQMRVRKNV